MKSRILKQTILFITLVTLLASCSSEQQATDSRPRHQIAAENAQAGAAFLKANAGQEGIIVLPGGLQYKILKAGTGPSPERNSYVTVHYRGTSIDGHEFDSSYARGKPMIFQANRVIPGWTEALLLMKQGAHWQLFIPEHLAYGDGGAGSAIGPKETLIFEVELLNVH